MANTITVDVRTQAELGLTKIAGLFKQLVGSAILPATAAAAAFGTTVAGAAVPVALLGAAMGPQIGKVKSLSESYDKVSAAIDQYGKGSKQALDAQKAYNLELKQMTPATASAAKSFQGLKNDFAKWSDSLSGDTMPIFTKGLNAMRTVLPMLTPFVKDAAKQLGVFADKLEKGVKTDRFKQLMGDFQKFSSGALQSVISGVTTLAKKAGEFVTSDGFKNFLATGQKEGPGIAKMFQDLAESVGKFIVAAGPMAGLSLKVLESMASALNAIPMDVLQVLVPTLLGAAAAIKVLTVAQIALNIAMAANPVGIVIAALALLAGAFYVAWNKSETFRNVVTTAFDLIKIGALAMAKIAITGFRFMTNAFMTLVGAILHGAAAAFGWIPGLGPKLKTADKAFKGLKDGVNKSLESISNKVNQWDAAANRGFRERQLKMQISDWNNKLESAKKRLKTVPASKRAKLNADIADLTRKINAAKGHISSLHGKTVVIDINERVRRTGVQRDSVLTGSYGYAAGGPVGTAASGGPRSNSVLVGEQGPEIVDLAPGSFVHPSGNSRSMMNNSGGSGGLMHITLQIGDKVLGDLIIDPLKKKVRTLGGVHAALGT